MYECCVGIKTQPRIYETQEHAWMDERVMLRWVEDVLAPYVACTRPSRYHPRNPSGFIPLPHHGVR